MTDNAPLVFFETAAHAGERLDARYVRFEEAIGAPYRVVLTVALPDRDADIAALLGQNGTLTFARAGIERRIHGVILRVLEGENTTIGDLPAARVVLEPALALGRLNRNTRIFQAMTVPEILAAVLEELLGVTSRAFRDELSATYPTREYCVQYRESDYDFVHRLMEEEGIAYTFDHEGDTETMVLVDSNDAYLDAVTTDGPLPYATGDHHGFDRDAITDFHLRLDHTPTKITTRDWDWTQGAMIVTDEQGGADPVGRERELYEHGIGRSLSIVDYDAGARRYQAHDAARQKGVRLEAVMRDEAVGWGASRAAGLGAGVKIELTGAPDPAFDGEYLVTRVSHYIAGNTGEGWENREEYENQFQCIPAATAFRPRRVTPKPIVTGVELGVVTGPAGEEIHVDEHGRVKVLFSWDRLNPADETSSCWLRVKQEWAGPGWGHWWVPRIGMEVMIHFVDGDPDRPLVTGALYDADRPLPYPLPDEKTKSTIKSNSSLGGGGFNEFRFEDKAGEEQIYTHAQKDYDEVVEHDHSTLVHHDQSNEVDKDQTQTVHKTQTERVDSNQEMSIGANRAVHVEGDYEETVDGTETRHVIGDVTESFAANETRDVSSSVTETIGGGETRTIGASHTESIGGSHTLTVAGDHSQTIGASLTESADGGITITTPGSFDATAAGPWTVDAQGGITIIAPAGVTIVAPGGVTRVDSSWALQAGTNKKFAAIAFEVYADKYELTGMEIGFTGFKMSEELSGDFNSASLMALKSVWAKTAGMRQRMAGLVTKAAQCIRM